RRLLRAHQRDLDRRRRTAAKGGELFNAHLPPPAQPIDDDRTAKRRLLTMTIAERDRPPAQPVESLERLYEMSIERVTAHLAVGDDLEYSVLAQRRRVII